MLSHGKTKVSQNIKIIYKSFCEFTKNKCLNSKVWQNGCQKYGTIRRDNRFSL